MCLGDKSVKGGDNRLMIHDAPFPDGPLAFLHGGKKLLFIGDEGSERLGDKPRISCALFLRPIGSTRRQDRRRPGPLK